ncbi:hypothetical protein LSCM1_00257 [Leishmania martiniquensis]|uniref:Uncharacterized protein n=1 Tax=Leishmania martiniquensis TaxID=1580590 RepID=A0A836K9P3_9TRYP|nr:hypothetical protein LSCM1_00257 [Leishmania martiniquensis]
MQGVKIALLVITVVIFVVLAALLIFLICWFSRRRCHSASKANTSRYLESVARTSHDALDTGGAFAKLYRGDPRLRPSAYLLYFLDFQGKLQWVDFRTKPAVGIATESAMQQYIFENLQPTIQEGSRLVRLPPEMLALSYVNDNQALVVMDLDRLLARDAEFGARMRHTAERPLLLSRLVADSSNESVFTALHRYGHTGGDAAVAPAAQAGAPRPTSIVTSPPQQHHQQVQADLRESCTNPMAIAPGVPAATLDTPTPPPVAQSSVAPPLPLPLPGNFNSVYAFDASGMAPTPVIHPCGTHHITTSTLVSVTAASYTVLHVDGSRTELGAANTERIEAARLRWDRRQSLVVPLASDMSGSQCVIDPITGTAKLFAAPSALGTGVDSVLSIECERADALYYTVERINSTQWLSFCKPFYLPAGRWCVRARAVLHRDNSSRTAAKVFTVYVM